MLKMRGKEEKREKRRGGEKEGRREKGGEKEELICIVMLHQAMSFILLVIFVDSTSLPSV